MLSSMSGIRPVALLLVLVLLGSERSVAAYEASDAARIRAVFERALPGEQFCEIEFLRHLGWRFETSSCVRMVTYEGGRPGRYKDLAAAQAAGCLRIRVPPGFNEAQARASAKTLLTLADTIPSRLAYRHKLTGPVDRATKRLSGMTEAERFVFPEILGIVSSPIYIADMPTTEWTRRENIWYATRSSARAMEALFELGATAECYVGQLLAKWAVQYELFGRDWFDRIFTKDELAVGRPNDVIKTPVMAAMDLDSKFEWRALLLHGRDQKRDPILALAPHGPMAFKGLGGVVMNQSEENFTQDNILIVSASQSALDELQQGGGTRYFNRETARLWEIANSGRTGIRIGPIDLGGLTDAAEKQIDEILERPMFSEILSYVHPDGVVPLAFTVKHFIPKADTPVTLRINFNGVDDVFYQRYRKAFVQGCLAQRRKLTATAPEIADR